MNAVNTQSRPQRRWLAAVLAALYTLVSQAAPPALQVGTAADYQPLTYVKDGTVVGMEADFARLLGAQLGKTLQFRIMPAAELLPALEKGEIDLVMSGWRITPEREQRVLFADSYLRVGLMAIIRTDDVMRFHNPAMLLRGGYKAAAISDSTATAFIASSLSKVTVVPVANAQGGLQALQEKRADVFIDDAASSWIIATDPRYGSLMSLGRLLTEEPVAWAVNKSRPELRDQLNRALQTLRQTGVLEHVYNRWIPMESSAP
ncbi:MAG: transporter substrate-binding domain-containing protein [Spongiibacteraceae bacterium]